MTKVCTRCKAEKPLSEFRTHTHRNGKDYTHNSCKKCNVEVTTTYHKTQQGDASRRRYRATVHGKASALINSAKTRCRSKSIEFSLTHEWVEQALVGGKCQVTGI